MDFRPITLRKDNGEVLKFNPENIDNIIFDKDKIIIYQFEGKDLISTKKYLLKKDEYYYPNWHYFILQLTRIFEIEDK